MKQFQEYIPAKLCTCKGRVEKDGKNVYWYAYYSIRNPETGKMERPKIYGKINYIHTKAERLRAGNILVASINKLLSEGHLNPYSPKEPEKPKLKLIEHFNEGIKLLGEKADAGLLELDTRSNYKSTINALIDWMDKNKMADILPEQFTRQHALKYREYLIREKKLAGVTLNNKKQHISYFFNQLVENEVLPSNPFAKIKSLRTETGKNIAFTEEQEGELSEYLMKHNPRLYLFCRHIYYCYIRRKELLRQKVVNESLRHRRIIIYGSAAKNDRQASVEIPDAFIPLVQQMDLDRYSPDDFLFGRNLETCSHQWHPNRVTELHTQALRKLNFPKDVTIYSWKHSGVVSAYNAGVDIYSIMRQLRHSSLDHTMIYLKSLGLSRNTEFATKMR